MDLTFVTGETRTGLEMLEDGSKFGNEEGPLQRCLQLCGSPLDVVRSYLHLLEIADKTHLHDYTCTHVITSLCLYIHAIQVHLCCGEAYKIKLIAADRHLTLWHALTL